MDNCPSVLSRRFHTSHVGRSGSCLWLPRMPDHQGPEKNQSRANQANNTRRNKNGLSQTLQCFLLALPAWFAVSTFRRVQVTEGSGYFSAVRGSDPAPFGRRGIKVLGHVDQEFLPVRGDRRGQNRRLLLARPSLVLLGKRRRSASASLSQASGRALCFAAQKARLSQ